VRGKELRDVEDGGEEAAGSKDSWRIGVPSAAHIIWTAAASADCGLFAPFSTTSNILAAHSDVDTTSAWSRSGKFETSTRGFDRSDDSVRPPFVIVRERPRVSFVLRGRSAIRSRVVFSDSDRLRGERHVRVAFVANGTGWSRPAVSLPLTATEVTTKPRVLVTVHAC